jgi:hypothetical protein
MNFDIYETPSSFANQIFHLRTVPNWLSYIVSSGQLMTTNSLEAMWHKVTVENSEISRICLEALRESIEVQPGNLVLGIKAEPTNSRTQNINPNN